MKRAYLLLSLCLLLLTGCSLGSGLFVGSTPATESKAPPLKSFQTPALSFNYPGNLYEKHGTNGNIIFMATSLDPTENPSYLTYYDIQELIVLNVIQKIQPKILNIEELRQANLKDIQQLGKVTILSEDKLLQASIPVLEYILSSPQGSLHIKQYLHFTQTGDTLIVSLSTPEKNWANIQSVVTLLEQSLDFET